MQKAAIAIVLSEDKSQVLLVQRKDVPVWVLPGGGIDDGESPDQAAVREALEETGLTVSIIQHIAHYSPTNRFTRDTFTYECRVKSGELTLTDETSNIAFFPIDSLPSMLIPPHKVWLMESLRKNSFPIKKPIPGVSYCSILLYLLRHPSISYRYLKRYFKPEL